MATSTPWDKIPKVQQDILIKNGHKPGAPFVSMADKVAATEKAKIILKKPISSASSGESKKGGFLTSPSSGSDSTGTSKTIPAPIKKAVSIKSTKDAIGGVGDFAKRTAKAVGNKETATKAGKVSEEEKIKNDTTLDKEAVKKLRAFVNAKTSLDNASQYIKPIALLDYYAPYVKIRLFYPKRVNGKYLTVDLLTSEFLTSSTDSPNQALRMNNYVESLSLVAEGGSDIKFTLKLIDSNLDFTDSILMRFSKEFGNGIFLEIEYGWSNKEKKSLVKWNGEKKPVFFTNGFVGKVDTVEVDENLESKRIVTITGIRIDNLPGELSTVLPYNELGPYPMITYQFIKFLQLDAEQMKKIVQLASGYNASEPDKGVQRNKNKTIKDLKINSVIRGKEEDLKKLIDKFHNSLKTLRKSVDEKDPRFDFLSNIGLGTDLELNSKEVERFYISQGFKQVIQSKDSFGNLTEELMRKFTTIIRDIRIHPFEALKYIVGVMNAKINDAKISDENIPGILINDFVGILDKKKSSFDKNSFELIPRETEDYEIGTLAGWANWDMLRLDQIYDSNEALRMVGILPSDIVVSPTTSWGDLLNMCAQKCLVYSEALDLDESGEVKIDPLSNMPKKLSKDEINKKGKEKDASYIPILETSFDKKTKEVAFKLAKDFKKVSPMKIKCLLTNKEQALDMLKGIELLNEAKSQKSFRSVSEIDTALEKGNKKELREEIKTQAESAKKSAIETKSKVEHAAKKDFFYVINIYNDKQYDLFDANFAKNNILQGYSYRMHTQNEYAYNFNPGLPGTKLINFPDVLSFKPNLGNIITYLQNIISASKNLVIQVPDGDASRAIITSSDKKARERALEEKRQQKKGFMDDKAKAKGEETKELAEKIKNLQKEITDDENYLKSSIVSDEDTNAMYKNPIYLNVKTPLSAIYGNGKNNNDIGILKTNIVNFRKRFMASASSQYEASLEIMGDPSFNDIANFGTALIYIKVYNPDGSDSMHTGIYRLKGVRHELQSGAFKTNLSLHRDPKIDNPELLKDLESAIYSDALTKEEAWNRITDKINLQDFAKEKDTKGKSLQVNSATAISNTNKLSDAIKGEASAEKEYRLAESRERNALPGKTKNTAKEELNKATANKKATEEIFVGKARTIASSATS